MYSRKTARQRMLRGKEGIMSLAQGIVHWAPPAAALEAARKAAEEPDTNSYGLALRAWDDSDWKWIWVVAF